MFYFQTVTYLSQTGNTIVELSEELEKIEKSNRTLTVRLSDAYNLEKVERIAKERGMVETSRLMYIEIPSALAVSKR